MDPIWVMLRFPRKRLPPDVEPPLDGKLEAELQRISKTLGEDEKTPLKNGGFSEHGSYKIRFVFWGGGTVPSIFFTRVYIYIYNIYIYM